MKPIAILTCLLFLSACSSIQTQDAAPQRYVDAAKIPNAVPKPLSKSRFGNPSSYVVNSHRYYVLKSAKGYDKKGIGSWYGTKFHGHLTSTRAVYDMFAMTAASTELPLPTYAQVTNLQNGKQIIVKVNDRGPFDKDRIIDLSYAAARKIGYANRGTAPVEVRAIDPLKWQQQHTAATTPSQTLPPPSTTQPVTQVAISHQPRIFLQIGAFADQANAQQLQSKIATLTTDQTRVKTASYNNKPIYKVQIGPLKSVDKNDKVQQLLVKNGLGRAMTVVY
ncbi:MAG: septal ring lytic transglycosylase RlpA family protein [Gammaproteobacteria bacterium]|nr:septal ring lytic transglycosylase RlpA family protein [Gammaproteobacteria bacterium]